MRIFFSYWMIETKIRYLKRKKGRALIHYFLHLIQLNSNNSSHFRMIMLRSFKKQLLWSIISNLHYFLFQPIILDQPYLPHLILFNVWENLSFLLHRVEPSPFLWWSPSFRVTVTSPTFEWLDGFCRPVGRSQLSSFTPNKRRFLRCNAAISSSEIADFFTKFWSLTRDFRLRSKAGTSSCTTIRKLSGITSKSSFFIDYINIIYIKSTVEASNCDFLGTERERNQ